MDENTSEDYFSEDQLFENFSQQSLDYQGTDGDVVIASRIRLNRNLAEFPFAGVCSDDQLGQIRATVLEGMLGNPALVGIPIIDSDQLDELERQFLLELQSVTHASGQRTTPASENLIDDSSLSIEQNQFDQESADSQKGDALEEEFHQRLIDATRKIADQALPDQLPSTPQQGGETSLTINDEDHLCVQVVTAGFDLTLAWHQLTAVDDLMGETFSYAFSPKWGYLTACPANVGTGLRASVLLHLPALATLGRLDRVFRLLMRSGVVGRGVYGDDAWGDFYRISNQTTLGRTENGLVSLVQAVVPLLVDYERLARGILFDQCGDSISSQTDNACRALVLPVKRSDQELLSLISAVRLGIALDMVGAERVGQVQETFELTRLKKQLKVAVMLEHYASATKYRDRIRQLEERRYGH